MLIIDEAQNLPLSVLEQIRILSNLETDKEKLLQIILVGQLNLGTLLRSPELRQLDQRVSIRYQLEPLDRETVGAYVAHRLTIAGGSAAVTFAPKALDLLHRLSGGIPRLINLICDRALLAAFSVRENRITPDMVAHAAESLDVRPSPRVRLPRQRRLARRRGGCRARRVRVRGRVDGVSLSAIRGPDGPGRRRHAPGQESPAALPADAPLTILVGAYPASSATSSEISAR